MTKIVHKTQNVGASAVLVQAAAAELLLMKHEDVRIDLMHDIAAKKSVTRNKYRPTKAEKKAAKRQRQDSRAITQFVKDANAALNRDPAVFDGL